eukprot:374918_1
MLKNIWTYYSHIIHSELIIFIQMIVINHILQKNQTVIEELLGFVPPHKITTSAGKEVRVTHYSTKVTAIKHHSRFSLAKVTDLTLNSPTNHNEDKKKSEKEEKTEIISLNY